MTWTTLQTLIPKAAGKYDMVTTLKAIQICQEYRNISSKLFSDEINKNSFPHAYKNHLLTIAVANSAYGEKIQQSKHRIIESINKKMGSEVVKKIMIKLVEEEKMPKGKPDLLDTQNPDAIN